MPFKKGQSGNPAGKPKGAKDKVPRSFRAICRDFSHRNAEAIESALERGITDRRQAHRFLTILASLENKQHDVNLSVTLASLLGAAPTSSTGVA